MIERERHADQLDNAAELADEWIADKIREHSYRLNQATVHYVDCAYCSAETENGEKYCCKECRDDDELRMAAQVRNGR